MMIFYRRSGAAWRGRSSRQRTLNDDELRAVWRAAEACPGPYGSLVRFILLTATRRQEAAEVHQWKYVDGQIINLNSNLCLDATNQQSWYAARHRYVRRFF
jgi:hypothetical protein